MGSLKFAVDKKFSEIKAEISFLESSSYGENYETRKDWTSFLFYRAKLYPQTAGVKIKATSLTVYKIFAIIYFPQKSKIAAENCKFTLLLLPCG